MNRYIFPLMFAAVWIVGCSSAPTVAVIHSGVTKQVLRGKTIAVGGLTAKDRMTYPGQVPEMKILSDAGFALRRRLKHAQVLEVAAAWASGGPPPTQFAAGIPVVLGRRLTPAYLSKARSQGVDYLLWIDLIDNSVASRSAQWQSTHTEYPSCSCGQINQGDSSSSDCRSISDSSCCSSCCSSCRHGREVTEYHRSETATRRLGARYSLLDTATGSSVWRADSGHSRSQVNSTSSEAGFPPLPAVPLPPEESQIMQKMSAAVIGKLPR
jgi:hypothetical protein